MATKKTASNQGAPAAEKGVAEEAPHSDDAPETESDQSIEDTGAYLKGLLEALLFVSDHPMPLKELARAARIDRKRAQELLAELCAEHQGRGTRIEEVADGFTFRSDPMYAGVVRHFLSQRPVRLSRAQLETLAIVAYRQPITRPEVDDIRGVDASPVLKGLLERELIRILGKKDEPGRPILYGTTQAFLELFSLKSLSELPTLREFTELTDESRRAFEQKLGEEAPEGPLGVEGKEAESAEHEASEGEHEADAEDGDAHKAEAEHEGEHEADDDDEDDDEDDEDEDEDDEDDEDARAGN